MQRAERVAALSFAPVGSDIERVGFVFAQFLNIFAGVIGVDDQRGFRCVFRLIWRDQQCSLAIELREKTIGRASKARLVWPVRATVKPPSIFSEPAAGLTLAGAA